MNANDHDAIHLRVLHYGLERFEVLSNQEKHDLVRRFAAEILEEREEEGK
jgi:hypothetical protein